MQCSQCFNGLVCLYMYSVRHNITLDCVIDNNIMTRGTSSVTNLTQYLVNNIIWNYIHILLKKNKWILL